LKQSVEEFGRFSYESDVLDNLLARNATNLFGIPIYDSKLYIGAGSVCKYGVYVGFRMHNEEV